MRTTTLAPSQIKALRDKYRAGVEKLIYRKRLFRLKSPEFMGCMNSGRRWVFVGMKDLGGVQVYVVKREIIIDRKKDYFVFGADRRAHAITKFINVSMDVVTYNEETRAESEKARAALRKNPTDISAAIALSDAGML